MRPLVFVAFGCASVVSARHVPPQPVVTSAPDPTVVELALRQANPDLNIISVAQVLLTAFPPSLIQIAATNPATVPIILWEEFLDGSMPAWFANLPSDIRTYLVDAYLGNIAPQAPATPTADLNASPWLPASPSAWQSWHPSSAPTFEPSNSFLDSSESVPTSPTGAPTTQPTASSSDDLSSTDSTSTTSTRTSAPTSSPTNDVSDVDNPSNTAESQAENAGMSKSTKIGIAAGVPLGILAIVAIVACCFLARRRRRRGGPMYEKQTNSDLAPFVSTNPLYDENSSGSVVPGVPYEHYGFQGTTVVGGKSARSLPPLDTDLDPFQDSHANMASPPINWEAVYDPVPVAASAAYVNTKPSHSNRRRPSVSGASLRSIEEVDNEDGDIAAGTALGGWRKRSRSRSPQVSPIAAHDPMTPPFQYDPISISAAHPAFRSGSLKENRRSSQVLPNDSSQYSASTQSPIAPSRTLERRGSQSIGGGYRSLPSPHLRDNSQSYMLPAGEWLEDGEDMPYQRPQYRF